MTNDAGASLFASFNFSFNKSKRGFNNILWTGQWHCNTFHQERKKERARLTRPNYISGRHAVLPSTHPWHPTLVHLLSSPHPSFFCFREGKAAGQILCYTNRFWLFPSNSANLTSVRRCSLKVVHPCKPPPLPLPPSLALPCLPVSARVTPEGVGEGGVDGGVLPQGWLEYCPRAQKKNRLKKSTLSYEEKSPLLSTRFSADHIYSALITLHCYRFRSFYHI